MNDEPGRTVDLWIGPVERQLIDVVAVSLGETARLRLRRILCGSVRSCVKESVEEGTMLATWLSVTRGNP